MSRKIILIKQELLLLVYELNRSGLLAENEKIRPILAQLEKLLLCDRSEERFSRNAETDIVCRLLLEKKKSLCNILVLLHHVIRGDFRHFLVVSRFQRVWFIHFQIVVLV